MEERRKFVRLDTTLSVFYQVLPAEQASQSVTVDISGGGICLFVREPFKPGAQLQVEIQLPGRQEPVRFRGEVVWCEQYEVIGKTRRERSIEAGLRFLDLHPRDRQAIMDHVILSLKPHQPT